MPSTELTPEQIAAIGTGCVGIETLAFEHRGSVRAYRERAKAARAAGRTGEADRLDEEAGYADGFRARNEAAAVTLWELYERLSGIVVPPDPENEAPTIPE